MNLDETKGAGRQARGGQISGFQAKVSHRLRDRDVLLVHALQLRRAERADDSTAPDERQPETNAFFL